jgi:tetratricopeptide (TPR) repeat protein
LADTRARAAELEREREQLRAQLARTSQDLATLSVASVGEPNGLAQAEIDRLEARLAVYEAEEVPYSTEELVLFRMSRGMESSEAGTPAPPAGAGPLVAQAERQFKQGQFQQAEVTLTEMLAADDANAFTLANLAATQMEQGKDAEAEVNLRRALANEPRDPFTLATMGILKFRQEQYEDALDYLGLAAQYNPDSAVIHNYLGMALSEQGMRGPAETALRRAIQLQPGFGDAHFNLALVYILQEPPLRELARWHYQKALGAGHERNVEMEQLLDR